MEPSGIVKAISRPREPANAKAGVRFIFWGHVRIRQRKKPHGDLPSLGQIAPNFDDAVQRATSTPWIGGERVQCLGTPRPQLVVEVGAGPDLRKVLGV